MSQLKLSLHVSLLHRWNVCSGSSIPDPGVLMPFWNAISASQVGTETCLSTEESEHNGECVMSACENSPTTAWEDRAYRLNSNAVLWAPQIREACDSRKARLHATVALIHPGAGSENDGGRKLAETACLLQRQGGKRGEIFASNTQPADVALAASLTWGLFHGFYQRIRWSFGVSRTWKTNQVNFQR